MNLGFTFSVVSLFYSILLVIIFFSKKRLNSIENKIYSWSIVSNFIGVCLAITSYFLLFKVDRFPISNLIIAKGYLIYLVTYISILTLYVLVISNREKIDNNIKVFNKYLKIITVIYIIIVAITVILPIYFYNSNGIVYTYGPSANLIYAVSLVYIAVWIIYMIKNFNNLKTKKYLPLFAFIFIGIIVMIIQKLNPGLLLMTAMETYITFLMYFTIENPDIKMIEELTKTKNLAEKYNNDKSVFLFNMTQQIRYPLNVIEQITDQILEEKDIEKIKEKALELRNSRNRISYIINGVLDVSTMDAKKIKVMENKYKIDNLINEISIRAEKEAAKKNLEFRKNVDDAMPELLYGDSIRLKQIINAIISNSIKYTEKGFVELNVNSVISFDVCRIIISVKDSGKGINAEEVNKLFDNKQEKVEIEKIDESEITLDIAKKMLNLIGGTLTVQTEKNNGSEFTIILDQKIVTSENNIMDMVNKYEKLNNKETILFVSDEEEERILYKKKLSNKYDVELSNNGEDCLKKIRQFQKYDYIILREEMKKLGSKQIIEKLNAIKEFNTPIIILSENKDKMMHLVKEGYKYIITKDMTSTQLLDFIEKIRK